MLWLRGAGRRWSLRNPIRASYLSEAIDCCYLLASQVVPVGAAICIHQVPSRPLLAAQSYAGRFFNQAQPQVSPAAVKNKYTGPPWLLGRHEWLPRAPGHNGIDTAAGGAEHKAACSVQHSAAGLAGTGACGLLRLMQRAPSQGAGRKRPYPTKFWGKTEALTCPVGGQAKGKMRVRCEEKASLGETDLPANGKNRVRRVWAATSQTWQWQVHALPQSARRASPTTLTEAICRHSCLCEL